MDKKMINNIILEENFSPLSAEELRKELDRELEKSEPDYDLADELAAAVLEAEGRCAELPEGVREAGIAAIKEEMKRKKRRLKLPKWAVGAAAVVFLTLVSVNIFSIAAYGENFFSAAIRITESGIVIDFAKQEQEENAVVLPTSEEDPYGFTAKLAEYDIHFDTPHYIPEGFVLTDVYVDIDPEYHDTISFVFEKGKQSIGIDYLRYYDQIYEFVIPSDHFNISEREVNGCAAIVSMEDNQFTITYERDKIAFFMFTVDVPYGECEKIVESIK
ncbi:MAG: DUF4367 domain-containing protein [Firmicutes bacterium]|nr:DUF4367 domain-containing protein [[Eubacterium] siraeum]MCM1488121.1 DUF4367 domain-containing protein [Bacillota bacterium]